MNKHPPHPQADELFHSEQVSMSSQQSRHNFDKWTQIKVQAIRGTQAKCSRPADWEMIASNKKQWMWKIFCTKL